MLSLRTMLGEVELPGTGGLRPGAGPRGVGHMQPAFIVLAVVAVGLIVFLSYDFFRQKRGERRERKKLQRFRDKRRAQDSVRLPTRGTARPISRLNCCGPHRRLNDSVNGLSDRTRSNFPERGAQPTSRPHHPRCVFNQG